MRQLVKITMRHSEITRRPRTVHSTFRKMTVLKCEGKYTTHFTKWLYWNVKANTQHISQNDRTEMWRQIHNTFHKMIFTEMTDRAIFCLIQFPNHFCFRKHSFLTALHYRRDEGSGDLLRGSKSVWCVCVCVCVWCVCVYACVFVCDGEITMANSENTLTNSESENTLTNSEITMTNSGNTMTNSGNTMANSEITLTNSAITMTTSEITMTNSEQWNHTGQSEITMRTETAVWPSQKIARYLPIRRLLKYPRKIDGNYFSRSLFTWKFEKSHETVVSWLRAVSKSKNKKGEERFPARQNYFEIVSQKTAR